tara:strand:+ start:312 stop:587 length:276 start_codon:yes stop_codon:yes gene_type:complete
MFKIQFNMNEADSNTLMNAIKVLGKNQSNEELGEVCLSTTEERGEEARRYVEVTDTEQELLSALHNEMSKAQVPWADANIEAVGKLIQKIK